MCGEQFTSKKVYSELEMKSLENTATFMVYQRLHDAKFVEVTETK